MNTIKMKLVFSILLLIAIFSTINAQAKDHLFEKPWDNKSANTIELLFVEQAMSADITQISSTHCYKLVLNGVPKNLLYFTDQPNRIVGHIENTRLIQLWNRDKSTPNVVLDGKIQQAGKIQDVNIVLILTHPHFDAKQSKMYYHACVTDVAAELQQLPSRLTEVNLFIDPFHDGGEV